MATLRDTIALITGAGSGVGRATALLLAEHGVHVGLLGRRVAPLEATAQEVQQRGGRSLVLPADVADETAVGSAVDRLVAEFGGVDLLVHSAGVGLYGPVEHYSLADWQATFGSNVTGLFLCARAIIPHLRARGGGSIIAISSGAGRRGYANLAAYSAAKFAVIGFMESLAEELGPDRIKCSTILPGSILTEFGPHSIEEKRASGNRYLQPEDVAEAILYLLRQPAHAWTQQLNLWPF